MLSLGKKSLREEKELEKMHLKTICSLVSSASFFKKKPNSSDYFPFAVLVLTVVEFFAFPCFTLLLL